MSRRGVWATIVAAAVFLACTFSGVLSGLVGGLQ